MIKWNRESVGEVLKQHGIAFEMQEIEHGVQFQLEGGTPVDLYETSGRLVVRGKASDEKALADELFNAKPSSASKPAPLTGSVTAKGSAVDDRVFIVYGHDKGARNDLELMLLRMDLKPVILSNMAPEGKTIIEALMANVNVRYAVVLLTPDDEGHRFGQPAEKKPRARQNVVLELGMFLSALGRERVAILHKGNLELPSDISGLIYIPFENSVQEGKNKLAASLQKAGFFIDINALSAE